jgi:hypothetical protein
MRKAIIIIGIVTGLFAHVKGQAQENANRVGQVSFVPGFGTGHGPKDQRINRVSINILGGNEYATHGAEIGTLFNLNQSSVTGAQLAGLYNQNHGKTKGAQISGLTNYVTDSLIGLQIAGINNHVIGSVKGLQLASLVNSSTNKTNGMQLAGLGNYSQSLRGVQLSGLVNLAEESNGVQIAGIANVATETHGWQLASIYNQTRVLKGWQIGLVNVADSIESGAQVGLVNINRKNGLLEFGIEQSDVIPWAVSLRSGQDHLYSILFAGTQFKDRHGYALWSYGLGFGSKFFQHKKFYLNTELTTQELRRHQDDPELMNLLSRFSINFGFQILDHLSISTGPVLNFYVAQEDSSGEASFHDIAQRPFYEHSENGYSQQAWFGYQLSIKF